MGGILCVYSIEVYSCCNENRIYERSGGSRITLSYVQCIRVCMYMSRHGMYGVYMNCKAICIQIANEYFH